LQFAKVKVLEIIKKNFKLSFAPPKDFHGPPFSSESAQLADLLEG